MSEANSSSSLGLLAEAHDFVGHSKRWTGKAGSSTSLACGSCNSSDSGNNNTAANNGIGKRTSNGGNNSSKSYSKILRQYLPSLNAASSGNNNNNNNKSSRPGEGLLDTSSSNHYEQAAEPQQMQKEKEKLKQKEKEKLKRQQQQQPNLPVGSPKSIVASALSRFKQFQAGSSSASAATTTLSSAKKSRSARAELKSEESSSKRHLLGGCLLSGGRNERAKEEKTALREASRRLADDNLSEQPVGQHLVGSIHRDQQNSSGSSQERFKRMGFLYLKRNASGGHRADSLEAERSTQAPKVAAVTTTTATTMLSLDKSSKSRRYLNNNSISNMLSSSCHQQQREDAEHTACLLLEDEDGEQSCCELSGGHMKTKSSSWQQTGRRFGAQRHQGGGHLSPKALALAGCLVALALVALSSLAQLAMAQQPFRSQPLMAASPPAQVLNQPPHQHQHQQPQHHHQQPQQPQQQQQGQSQQALPVRPQPAAGSLVANVNCNKIKGHVTLTPNPQGGATVSTQISAGPPGEVYQWSVHQFPVKPGAGMCSCSPLILGTKLIDLSEMHGNLPSDQEFSVQSSLNLFSFDSPVGHSLMLRGMKTGMVACATFLPTSRKSNYRAKFHSPLSGSVTIFQTAFGTSFISHLMYSNGTRRHSTHRFDLLVRSDDDLPASSLLSGSQASLSSVSQPALTGLRADSLAQLEQREHEHELNQCRRFGGQQVGEALFRNLTFQLSVSTENFGMRGRTAMVLPQIPFETFSSVFVVVYSEYDPFEPIACAPLKFVKPKTAAAKFQSVSVQGSVLFSQDSPYDVTVARVNLNLPNSDGHSYGIDELPMILRRKSDTRVCPNIREIIYNPHHVEPSSVPPEGEATSDQYAVGDLSGKYGSLTGKSSEKIQVNDYNLPLFGPISIVGRAMTVYSADGVAVACSNVELTAPMTTAFATFDFGIQGQFIFRQPVNDCNGDTYVYIEVSKPVSSSSAQASTATSGGSGSVASEAAQSRSLDHNWHIHVNPVDSGLNHLSTTDCLPAGAHFNPYNTSTSSIYSRDCTPFNVLRCELGDLSSKMFTIEIPPYKVKGAHEPDIGKFFGTDIDLPLCGPVSIVNRSVVVHHQDFGSQRLACSTVIEFKPRS